MPAESSIPATSPRLGEYLACSGDAIENALDLQANPSDDEAHRRLGDLLLEAEAIDRDALLEAIARQRVDRLRACPLFSSLSDDELRDLSVVFQEVTVEPGEQFITQDDRDPSLFVLASGRLEVFRIDDQSEEIRLASVFPGEPVGEMGYFSDGIRSASVRARDTSQLLRASYEDLTDCFEHVPAVASAFLDVVTHRLRKTNLLYQERESRNRPTEQELRHLEEFLEIEKARELGEGIDGLIERLVLSASRLTDADRASLFLVDPDTGELWSKVAEGMETREIRVPAGAGVVGWVASNGHMLNIPDAYGDERFNPDVDRRTGYRTTSILCAPVKALDGDVVGAVQVINKQLGVFTEDDEMLLRAFADQAAVALDNINVYRDVLVSFERMASILAVSTVAAESPDLPAMMRAVGRKLAELLRCTHAAVYRLDAPGLELLSYDPEEGAGELRLPARESVAGHCLEQGAALNIADAYEDPRFDPSLDPTPGERTRSVVCAPIRSGDARPLGVVVATNKLDGIFSEDDLALVEAVAAHLALHSLVLGSRATGEEDA